MNQKIKLFGLIALMACASGNDQNAILATDSEKENLFLWENANVYFLLTDRFYNQNTSNDINYNRTKETATLRGFEGGDIAGITKKIEEGYFDRIGVNAIWFTPVVEQIKGAVDEGTGVTYGYHGYWAADWTSLDPNFGTEEELKKLVQVAHQHDIRILLDVVLNHTGPVTAKDPAWPSEWVRTEPACTYQSYETTTSCTLVKNLPDILTSSDEPVELPPSLVQKWKQEGRYEKEIDELNAFFDRTGYPRAPRFYLIKWLVDMIKDYGADGFRVDTAKHLEEGVWKELYDEAILAFAQWKEANPNQVLDDNEFFMMGEVYNYNITDSTQFDFGDKKVNYFDYGFNSLINFDFKISARAGYEDLFSKYSELLNGPMKGKTVLNYISSHDDGSPFDPDRSKPFESANKLLLCPGGAQIYYGDETARMLVVEGAEGDANLRSFMNWEALQTDSLTKEIYSHWQKLGLFRKEHVAVGAGKHKMLHEAPYIFERIYDKENVKDIVIVGLDLTQPRFEMDVSNYWKDGTRVKDYYSGNTTVIEDGKMSLNLAHNMVLLAEE